MFTNGGSKDVIRDEQMTNHKVSKKRRKRKKGDSHNVCVKTHSLTRPLVHRSGLHSSTGGRQDEHTDLRQPSLAGGDNLQSVRPPGVHHTVSFLNVNEIN